ncbi:hypothetical protein [uncultured Thomasclavelia sp.]|uniref:hypothetical protein n=1 Tax=uncultured Thomasclavelia sp. TaxID=3025759 RepID=UPI002597EC25|nr:hypothetical protein [uncultured Thomasclavelia sp.]
MENENLVTEEVTENVEQPTEEVVEVQEEGQELVDGQQEEKPEGKFYTDDELNEMLNDRFKRGRKSAYKEAKRKYGKLESILKQGLEVDSVEEATNRMEEFYHEQGVELRNDYFDEDDLRTLAYKDAEDIINAGNDLVEAELQRLADLGVENMNKREKVMFEKLHQNHQYEKDKKELASIGVSTDVLESKEFKEFASKLNPKLPIKEKYEIYEKIQPKPKVETIGSMASNPSSDNGVKESYTYEEAMKFTREDFDKNPELFKAVENSMKNW